MGLRGRNNLIDETFFFVTTTVVRFLHVFEDQNACELLIKNIKYYQNKYNFNLLGYVIMPSHFHCIIQVEPKFGTISDIMRDIKKYAAWDIMEYFERNEKYTLIFREESKGYSDQEKKFWQKRFDDKVIRNKKQFYEILKYIHTNPVKAGIAKREEDYKYSSARNYLREDHSVIFVNTKIVGY